MAIKKSKQTPINENTERFLKFLQMSGTCTETQARHYLSENEFETFRRNGMFKSSSVRIKREQLKKLGEVGALSKDEVDSELKAQIPQVEVFKISDKCRRFAKNHFNIRDMYTSNSKIHDVVLGAKVIELQEKGLTEGYQQESVTREELKTAMQDWKENRQEEFKELLNEYEEKCPGFIEKFENENPYGSTPDFCYRNEQGQMVAYEITTINYDHYTKCLKEFSTTILGYEYTTYHV